MYSLNNKCQYFFKLKPILSFGFFALMTVSVLSQAPDCSIITYNTDTQSRLEIDNLDRLQCMSEDLTADYILLNDIDASPTQTWNGGLGFAPVGTFSNSFTGKLNGDGFKITGLFINRPDSSNVGFFAHNEGDISNLGLEDIDIRGGFRVGALAGFLRGYNDQIYVTGSIEGDQEVGGFGGIANFGTLINSYSTASVHADDGPVGGLVGSRTSFFNLQYSYASGQVTIAGEGNSSGLIGAISGSNSQIINSYWNVETSLQGFGAGTPITLSEMRSQSSFSSWNFTSIWAIDAGNSYPYLRGVSSAELPGVSDTSLVTPFSGGIGTISQPFQINTIEQLQAAEEYENYIFELISDIDASATTAWNNGLGFDPLGSPKNPFSGPLFGNGYKISGLTINRSDSNYIGLFASKNIGVVVELGLEQVNIKGKNYVGALAGRNTTKISKVYVTGVVEADSISGGLVGENTPSEVTGFTGGCEFAFTICDSYSLVDIKGNNITGGLVGNNVGDLFLITGFENGRIENSYSAGKVLGKNQAGGLIGKNSGLINNSYWNSETSGLNSSDGGTPLTTNQMKLEESFSNWNFSSDWSIEERQSYPYLQGVVANPIPGINQKPIFAGGSGTIDNPFQLQNINQFQNISNNLSSYFVLNNDINAAGTSLWNNGGGFTPIGDIKFPFKGTIDGKGYAVIRININRPLEDTVGVFGVIGPGAEVRDLGLEGVNIEGRNVVGGLAGLAEDSTVIENTFVMGQVTGINDVGGLLGSSNGFIEYAYSINNVTGNENVGGIAGSAANGSTISTTYAAGNVTGSNNIGGILGLNTDATISGSYWNTETGGVTDAVGEGLAGESTGLTTAEMMQTDSYTNWDFDFEGDWFIVSDENYPWLQDNEQNPAPGPVTLINPGDEGEVAIPTSLEWKAFPEANSYEIQIGTDAEMESVIFDSTNIQSLALNLASTTLFEENQTYYWKVRPDNANWSAVNTFTVLIVTSTEPETDIPDSYGLSQNYPNPFNPSTVISYQLPVQSDVSLQVFDVLGKEVATLVDGRVKAGYHVAIFNAGNLASGMYIYRLKAGSMIITKKLTLIK